jgi:STE24 endopeptidase
MTTLDPEKQKQAKEYARIRRRLWLVETVSSAIYALLWLFLGWATSLRDWLGSFTTNPWLLVPLFVFIFGGIYTLPSLPLSYYSGFVLPHRFGQSNQTIKDWVIDQLKGLASGLAPARVIVSCPARDRQPLVVVDSRGDASLYGASFESGSDSHHAAVQ